MKRKLLTWILLSISFTSFSQIMTEEAIYYNNTDIPYKIERKYREFINQTLFYVKHDNSNSYCLKKEEFKIQDTTIIQETYFEIFSKKSKIERFLESTDCIFSSNQAKDTVNIKFFDFEKTIGDTTLTDENAKNSDTFLERIKYARVPLILNNEISINLDSLIHMETVKSYFLNKIPIKIEVFDSDQKIKNKTICESLKDCLICKYYELEDSTKLYKIDTIIWNTEKTVITWITNRSDWGKTYKCNYYIKDEYLNIVFDSTSKKEIQYLDKKDIFGNLLIGQLIYNDVLFYMELLYFDKEKIVKEVSIKGDLKYNKYSYDNKNRIIEQETYWNNDLKGKILYTFKE